VTGRRHGWARSRRSFLVWLASGLILGAPATFATTSAQFVGSSTSASNQVTAGTVAPPTGLGVGRTCAPGPGIAARGQTSAAGLNSLTLTPPAATQAGDVMVAQVANRDGTYALTAPAGWALVTRDSSSATVTSALYVKVAGANEPAATFSMATGNVQMVGGIVAYSGVSTSNPVDTFAVGAGQGTSATVPSVTTTVANAMLVHTFLKRQEFLAAPAGTTPRWGLTSGTGAGNAGATAADVLFAGPGVSTARSSSSANSFVTEWVAHTVALRPALGPPSVAVSWTASSSSGATGYLVERLVGGAVQASSTVTPISATGTTDGPLVNGTAYTYRVRAYRGTWQSTTVTASLAASC
jgi:hypothetical protein